MASVPENRTGKISLVLAARLANLAPDDIIRVVVLLNTPTPAQTGRRLTADERARAVAVARETTERLWGELRPLLDTTGATRVDAGGPSPFGGLVLDIPVKGVVRLADASSVRAILDDQLLTRPQTA